MVRKKTDGIFRGVCAVVLLSLAIGTAPFARAETPAAAASRSTTFTNPIIHQDAPDPWVIFHNGVYYFTATLDPEGGVWIWSSRDLSQLDHGRKVKIWTAPPNGPASHEIWAPELHWIGGHWYLYFTACNRHGGTHHQFVLEAKTDDPQGAYLDRGRIDPELKGMAIDGSVLQMPDGKLYWLYSDGRLHIAPMLSPTRVVASRRALLARATFPWERGWIEAPEALIHNGRVFIAYSAGNSATPQYSIGLLSYTGGDVLNPNSWKKSHMAVFYPYFGFNGAVYTVGHNCFTTSPDGQQDWIVYHGKDWRGGPGDGGFGGRKTRIQQFTWSKDGSPDFGHPIPSGVKLQRPSGEK